ncbi:MAG: hypothetical protein ABI378_11860 [Chitinophagaceae bacterium]
MKRHLPFLAFILALSFFSGWLMSRMSWIGRVGVNLIHQEYKFLKVWYEAGAVVFIALLFLFFLQYFFRRRSLPIVGFSIQVIALLLAGLGFWLSMVDFKSDISHRLLKQNFHVGVYLFWFGWACISVYIMAKVKRKMQASIDASKTAEAAL